MDVDRGNAEQGEENDKTDHCTVDHPFCSVNFFPFLDNGGESALKNPVHIDNIR